ncbi:hypothetical protein MJO28_003700 [Puccinia striiformis f. sp. tritici]|uniref:Uncharacterized protein n=1 Tax=Puccinia striiformis f. sp. tritici TaxID=168172 RepID=A0ACC0END1_9BASI|nr:hypothetical protein MJO28_003700 [Puccinia striiformis f. sp. tritici]
MSTPTRSMTEPCTEEACLSTSYRGSIHAAINWVFSGYEELLKTGEPNDISNYIGERLIKADRQSTVDFINAALLKKLFVHINNKTEASGQGAQNQVASESIFPGSTYELRVGTPIMLTETLGYNWEGAKGKRFVISRVNDGWLRARMIIDGKLGEEIRIERGPLPPGHHLTLPSEALIVESLGRGGTVGYPIRVAFAVGLDDGLEERTPLVGLIRCGIYENELKVSFQGR